MHDADATTYQRVGPAVPGKASAERVEGLRPHAGD
jgi:hypothetical protein